MTNPTHPDRPVPPVDADDSPRFDAALIRDVLAVLTGHGYPELTMAQTGRVIAALHEAIYSLPEPGTAAEALMAVYTIGFGAGERHGAAGHRRGAECCEPARSASDSRG